jgi:hypothetical protein
MYGDADYTDYVAKDNRPMRESSWIHVADRR